MMRRAGLFKSKNEDVLYWNCDAFDAQPLSRRCAEENKGIGMKQSLLSRSKRKWRKNLFNIKNIFYFLWKQKATPFLKTKNKMGMNFYLKSLLYYHETNCNFIPACVGFVFSRLFTYLKPAAGIWLIYHLSNLHSPENIPTNLSFFISFQNVKNPLHFKIKFKFGRIPSDKT